MGNIYIKINKGRWPVYTKEEILNSAKENNVRFIRLQFTDIFGVLKNVATTTSQLEKALAGDLMFDGSSIDGFVRIEESDMYLQPDLSTWAILPWMGKETRTARLICDVLKADRTPFEGDPRYILHKALAEADEMGYSMNVGPEAEFFLFQTGPDGKPTLHTNDSASYFDLTPVDGGERARRDIILALEEMGFEVEASHHESAPGQHEIDFKYAGALAAADKVQTFKYVVRVIAQNHGLHATFMPKPLFGVAGSGMHINQSLFTKDKNAFFDPDGENQLSSTAYHYLGGLIHHIKALTAIVNPTVNSYKRLISGYEAPVYIAWAQKNRSPLVRIPAKRGISSRMELRSPDPSCNPYLAFAVVLKAGLDGIKNKMTPPPPIEGNIFHMREAEMAAKDIETLPANLNEALRELKKNRLICDFLGEHILDRFIAAKNLEWEEYRTSISQWEIDNYLTKF
ncbi:MAG: glutamine synthetase family protein [Clostridiales bacterium]|jgi:glutamine synthetase|nr:glutamine synthetase family protein [Clostridiales bacterium]MDR2711672.1 glutamine synthetase family protein [Clostridiales bacterium]